MRVFTRLIFIAFTLIKFEESSDYSDNKLPEQLEPPSWYTGDCSSIILVSAWVNDYIQQNNIDQLLIYAMFVIGMYTKEE